MAFTSGINEFELYGLMYPAFKKQTFEVATSKAGNSWVKVTMMVEKPVSRKQDAESKRAHDYITCTAYGKIAEYIGKYVTPGNRTLVKGSIHTSSYNGKYSTDLAIERVIASDNISGEDGRKEYQTRQPNTMDPVMEEYMRSDAAINPDDLPF